MNDTLYKALFGDRTVSEVIRDSQRNLIKNRTRRNVSPQYRYQKKEYEKTKSIFISEMLGAIYNMEDDTNSKIRMTIHITKEDNTEETYSFSTDTFEKLEK